MNLPVPWRLSVRLLVAVVAALTAAERSVAWQSQAQSAASGVAADDSAAEPGGASGGLPAAGPGVGTSPPRSPLAAPQPPIPKAESDVAGGAESASPFAPPAPAAAGPLRGDTPPLDAGIRPAVGPLRALDAGRLRMVGLAALAEPAVAGRLGLDALQRMKVAEALKSRLDRLIAADADSADEILDETEKQLAAVLTDAQRAAWEALLSPISPEKPTAEAAVPVAADEAEEGPDAPDIDRLAGIPEPPPLDDLPGVPFPTVEPIEPLDPLPDPAALAAAVEPATPPEPPLPTEPETTTPAPAAIEAGDAPAPEPRLRFRFRFQPWNVVLDWFAQQADLSLVFETLPPGTFNYADDREYTPAQAIDLLNSVLLTKGFTLVRHERMLMLINLEDGIPPNLVKTIAPEEIDQRGEFELVRAMFSLDRVTPEEVESEVRKLIGPQGAVTTLPKSKQIMVTETAGRLRAIRAVIQRLEDPEGISSGQMRVFDLGHTTAEEALGVIRPLLDLPLDRNAAPDGSIRMVPDPAGDRLIVSGKPDKVARVAEILEMIDSPGRKPIDDDLPMGDPQMEVYHVAPADPQLVLAVMSTLMAGMPDVRLAIDEHTSNLYALARPTQHATIRATLNEMIRDAKAVEVIPLRVVDPQTAVLAIRKLFGGGDEKEAKPDPGAPVVDADPNTRVLLIRGTQGQIAQIRTLLDKMGEADADSLLPASRGTVRVLPIQGHAAQSVLDQIQEIWPSIRPNRVRVVAPSSTIPAIRPSSDEGAGRPGGPPRGAAGRAEWSERGALPFIEESPWPPGLEWFVPPAAPPERPEQAETTPGPPPAPPGDDGWRPAVETPVPSPVPPPVPSPVPSPVPPPVPSPVPSPVPPPVPDPEPNAPSRDDPTAARPSGARIYLAAAQFGGDPADSGTADSSHAAEAPRAAEPSPAAAPPPSPKEPPPIIVTMGPSGLIIVSEDEEALDEFEQLLSDLVGAGTGADPEITIFYLKHARAAIVAETLDRVFGGGTLGGGAAPGGGSPMGDLMGGMMGGGGGVLGALLGMGNGGGSITPSGDIRITPDPRLNALIVQANAADLATIEQLLKILDQKEGPEDILVVPKTRVIPVVNTQAEEIAEIIKQVYQDRMVTSGAAGGARQAGPSPQDFLQMLQRAGGRGGARGGAAGAMGGGARGVTEDVQRLSVSVDARTNSLILAAPEPLLSEAEALALDLDRAAVKTDQTIRVVTLHQASPTTVRQALSALGGDKVQVTSSGTTGQRAAAQRPAAQRATTPQRTAPQRTAPAARVQQPAARTAPRR
jgi:type II secretory pathway component GspD/PulD (secretin)